ncbi:hypothetical protein E2986_04879 [Frieseomelitta varia]|uniref:Uncharacterized protein n=1 Tax=Frieseomelitta varia TaxID=561572 RepID=A0A833W7J1_9HYME|nr:hypothetical protein E2986_04879 [Frieseomelitta varia]
MMQSGPSNDVSTIYVAKYNRFVDNILGRINKILRSNYDPVTVKLSNANSRLKSNKQKSKNKTKKNSSKTGTKKSHLGMVSVTTDKITHEISENTQKTLESAENITVPVATAEKEAVPTTIVSEIASRSNVETSTRSTNRRVSNSNSKKTNKTRGGTKNKTKQTSKVSQIKNTKRYSTLSSYKQNITSSSYKQKYKINTKKSKPKASATLYGLASLQRSGDVSVNMMSDHTMIKTRFILGPLILKVEKEFGRAAKKELRSATATTAEMSGKLSLRVLHGGSATLNSIRVLQPKQYVKLR